MKKNDPNIAPRGIIFLTNRGDGSIKLISTYCIRFTKTYSFAYKPKMAYCVRMVNFV